MKYTFIGVDKDLEISLKEYGLLISNEEHEDGSGTYFIIYKSPYDNNLFGTAHMSTKEIDEYMLGHEFMDTKDIQSVLEFYDITLENWFKLKTVDKLMSLITYFGADNIVGTNYNPTTYDEIVSNHLI
jgi:hypothetical protein